MKRNGRFRKKKSPFCNPNIIIDSGMYHQQTLKPLGEMLGNRSLTQPQSLTPHTTQDSVTSVTAEPRLASSALGSVTAASDLDLAVRK